MTERVGEQQEPGFLTIGQAVARSDEDLFVGRDPEMALFKAWLTSESVLPAVMNISGPGGVGKSALVNRFAQLATDLGREVTSVDGQDITPDSDALLSALTGHPAAQSIAVINAAKPLIVIDSFEELGVLSRYIEEEFLPALAVGVKVVVSGRHPVGRAFSGDVPWSKFILWMPLSDLSQDEAAEYLRARNIREEELIDQVIRATRGHPLALSMAADMVEQFGIHDFDTAPEWHVAVRSLVETLLRDLDDPALKDLLYACTVVRHFDESTLAAVSGNEDIAEAFNKLCRLSFVRPTQRGLMLHADIQLILRQDLQWRQPERYEELKTRRFEYYRDRSKSAPFEERAWLLAERLYLWGHSLGHLMLFAEDDPDETWVVAGRAEDVDQLLPLFRHFLTEVIPQEVEMSFDEYALEAGLEYARLLIEHPHARLRVARNRDGDLLGYSVVMPVTRSTYDLMAPHPVVGPTLLAYLGTEPSLPEDPSEADVHYLIQLSYGPERPDMVRGALMRDMFGLLALGKTYITTLPLPSWKAVFEGLGFRRLDEAQHSVWTGDVPTDGYLLDLSGIGVERWIEALMTGRPVRTPLGASDMEDAVLQALTGWRDDEALATNPLLDQLIDVQEQDRSLRAATLRTALLAAMERAEIYVLSEDSLALKAVRAAYIERERSHERIAESMHVSRTTFYRLLKKGTTALASAFAAG
jgi:hypothetical protein